MKPLGLPMAFCALLLAGPHGEAAPPPQDAPPARGERDRAFDFQMARARDLAGRAVASGDMRAGQDAFDAFMAASRLRPEDPVPLAEAGLLALDMGDGASAARMLAAVHEIAPTSGAFHFLRGSFLLTRGEYLDACAEFKAARGSDFRASMAGDLYFEARLGFGLQLVEGLQFEAALPVLNEVVEMKPNHPLVSRAYYNMALAYRRLQTPVESERLLRLCMERFPSYGPAYGELGDLFTELGRFDEAVAVLDRANRADPNYALGYLLKAQAQTLRGAFKEADAAFAEYEKRFPATGDSEFYRGMYYQKNQEPGKALERLRRALALDPSKIRSHYFISLACRDLGQEKEAEEALERWKKAEESLKKQHDRDKARGRDLLRDSRKAEEGEKKDGTGDGDGKRDGTGKGEGKGPADGSDQPPGDGAKEGGGG